MSERSRIRVLVVDDLADATDTMTMLLGLWGYDTVGCCDGPSALETARTYRPHVVLLDVAMPAMDGFQVARRLRALPDFSTTAIIGISGYCNDSFRDRALESGFDHYLVKPVEPCFLEELLHQVVSDAGWLDRGAKRQVRAVSGPSLIGWPLLRFGKMWPAQRLNAIGDRQVAKAVALVPPRG